MEEKKNVSLPAEKEKREKSGYRLIKKRSSVLMPKGGIRFTLRLMMPQDRHNRWLILSLIIYKVS